MSTNDLNAEMDQVTLGDKRVDIQTFDRYKGRKGAKDRLAIISPSLARAVVHYYREKKKTVICQTKNPATPADCCVQLGSPEQTFGMILFHYSTDPEGNFFEGMEDKLSGRVKFWKVSETRYSELSSIHKQFPLLAPDFASPQHDLIVYCTEENYQRMTFTPCAAAHWKKKQEWFTHLQALVKKGWPKLQKAMGSDMDEAELKQLLEIDAVPAANPSAASAPIRVDDILGDISGPVVAPLKE